VAGHPASRAGFVNASGLSAERSGACEWERGYNPAPTHKPRSAREGRAREAAQHRRIARAQGYGPGSPVLTRRTDRDGEGGIRPAHRTGFGCDPAPGEDESGTHGGSRALRLQRRALTSRRRIGRADPGRRRGPGRHGEE